MAMVITENHLGEQRRKGGEIIYISLSLLTILKGLPGPWHMLWAMRSISSPFLRRHASWSCCSHWLRWNQGSVDTATMRPKPENNRRRRRRRLLLKLSTIHFRESQNWSSMISYRPSASWIQLVNALLGFVKEHSGSLNLTLHEVPPFVGHFSFENIIIW